MTFGLFFYLSFAAHNLDGGFYNITVTEYQESEPFLVYANTFTCDDIKKTIPCPIPKGCKFSFLFFLFCFLFLFCFVYLLLFFFCCCWFFFFFGGGGGNMGYWLYVFLLILNVIATGRHSLKSTNCNFFLVMNLFISP